MAKHTYSVQIYIEANADWHSVLVGETRGFAEGYALGHVDLSGPSLPLRVIRDDGKVMLSYPGDTEVALGMIAGFPTPAQYEAAAACALESAQRLRDWAARAAERRPDWARVS